MSDLSTIIPLTIASSAILVACYAGLRGAGWLGHRERPERLVGKLVRFRAVESDIPLSLTTARVASFDGHYYEVELTSPIEVEGKSTIAIRISARHHGFPVSSASRLSILGVNGIFPNGNGFIACITLA